MTDSITITRDVLRSLLPVGAVVRASLRTNEGGDACEYARLCVWPVSL